MVLPLAPTVMFEQELQIIQEEANTISVVYPAVLQFTVYFKRIWLPLKDKVSIFGTSKRTNNFVESFHFLFFRKLGGIHPTIWNFLRTYRLLLLLFLKYNCKRSYVYVRVFHFQYYFQIVIKLLYICCISLDERYF